MQDAKQPRRNEGQRQKQRKAHAEAAPWLAEFRGGLSGGIGHAVATRPAEITAMVAESGQLHSFAIAEVHQLAQLRSTTVDAAFDGAHGAVAHFGGFFVGESRGPHQDQCLALFVGQLIEGHAEIAHLQTAVMGRFLR